MSASTTSNRATEEFLRQLIGAARELRGSKNGEPTRQEYVDFAYGQAALENAAVTREIAEQSVAELLDATESSA